MNLRPLDPQSSALPSCATARGARSAYRGGIRPPPAPPGIRDDELTERPIRITPGANEQIEETVMNGRRAVKVTQPNGNVYYLVEELGDQDNALHNSVTPPLRVPMWRILQF